jgi:hypothetical protein
MDNYELAEADYSKAIELEAKEDFYTNRGVVYRETKEYVLLLRMFILAP